MIFTDTPAALQAFGKHSLFLGVPVLLVIAACGGGEPALLPDARPDGEAPHALELPWEATPMGAPPSPPDNPTTPEKVLLGRFLFYDPLTSSDRETACATCHSEFWGMSDGIPRSIGVGAGRLAGPGRTGDNVLRRNAQALWNIAYQEALFWDGRVAGLEEQARLPFEAKDELNRDVGELISDLLTLPPYVEMFAAAFPSTDAPVTAENLFFALSAFQRSLVSDNSLYDAYVRGDDGAMTDEMVRGMVLFAEAGCSGCHAPPLFSSPRYADREVSPIDGIPDDGRFEATGDSADDRAFRVPSLRNVRETSPYFHTGATALLEDAVFHEINVAVKRGESRPLDADEASAIVLFLKKGLVDRSRDPNRPQEVPSGLPTPLDGFRIPR